MKMEHKKQRGEIHLTVTMYKSKYVVFAKSFSLKIAVTSVSMRL